MRKDFIGRVPLLGTFLQINNAEIAAFLAGCDLDFIIIDDEHGAFDASSIGEVAGLIHSREKLAILRTTEAPRAYSRFLDAGVDGFLVPGVESPEVLREIIGYTCYAPTGTRGACPWIPAANYGLIDWQTYAKQSDERVLMFITVETRRGVERVDEILEVDGIDAVVIGPFDLSVALGFDGNYEDPGLQAIVEELNRKVRAKGIPTIKAILNASDPAKADEGIGDGVEDEIVILGGDRMALAAGYRRLNQVAGLIRERRVIQEDGRGAVRSRE